MHRIKKAFLHLLVGILSFGILITSCKGPDTTSGIILDEYGPVAEAVVRVQTTENYTISDSEGHFSLSGLASGEAITVTAWKSGYYIAGAQDVVPGISDVEIHLEAHTDSDNPAYEWLPSQYHPGQGEDQGCAECHSNANSELSFTLPVDEWLQDAHSQAAINPRFVSMYSGTDMHGNQSPLTLYGSSRDYGRFPLGPDPDQPYFGPGYKLDFPDTAGNCAACHTPAASVNDPYSVDPTTVNDVPAEGVPCDFCHKVWGVRLDSTSGLPRPNMPGVLSYEFRRPPDGHQFFAGPFDDVAPGEDTYSPLQQQSQFCAPCHFGVFWDTLIYNSFGEWLESPYSDPKTGQTCQDCHMRPIDVTRFALPEAGGQARDPSSIFSHRMPGAADEEILQNAVTMNVDTHRKDDKVIVEVELINDQTGHHIPTDSPLRHLILLVEVIDENGEKLQQLEGPLVPDWGGVGEYADGYFAGAPGTAYAKILMELWTEISPSGAYWNPTRIVSDNRIPAMGSDTTTYIFKTSEVSETSEVSVTLLFRRAFIELMDQKSWDVPDIVMKAENVRLP
ncbi:MAG: carboxypeptidase regulatory-like domain-containing protein [Anaerolineales bacterium]|uniref:Carboxypeptidase regulatory-like domain-containing protein n=1 Tax=Candidatus Desulfolinea nitratireducens TaxID=2841698 RepID=A0A8J6NK35_9CHLR|nr:carboxypeptidase regulatory-like domain-containing protein [Candidatus Desulfolinea nitratireducens]MBL6961105.1 carboxypeptidase regulatory-like domain-containing protein [Anaerolineales bacterium]